MPYNEVMPKFGAGELHSGSKKGPVVKNPKQAVAIMYHEKGESASKPEYKASENPGLKGLRHALKKSKS